MGREKERGGGRYIYRYIETRGRERGDRER
jgi:hypothetical protein